MGESRFRNCFGNGRARHYKGSRRIPRRIRQKTRFVFSSVSLRQQRAQPFTCTEKGSDVEERAASRSKSQASGTSPPCRKRLSKLTNELLTNRFDVTHHGGCAVLFNKDTYLPDIKVKSIYLHDIRRVLPDKVVEGESGWVLQGVLSRASLRRQPPSGQQHSQLCRCT